MSVSAIVEKVQKLLALSKNNSSAEEAAVAAGIANKLIDEYRLSTADLETSEEGQLEPIEDDPDYLYETGRVIPWKKYLCGILAEHYGCAYWNDTIYTNGRKFSRFRLVGRRSDIGICRYMFSWLMLECQRLADKEAKGCGHVFVFSYCEGFVNGVAAQLKSSRAEVQKQASSAAIVKIDARYEESKAAMYTMHELIKSKSTSYSRRDGIAFAIGQSRGKAIHLGASIASGGTKALKG